MNAPVLGSARAYADLLPGVPPVESPFFDSFAADLFPDPRVRDVAERLHRDGFAVIDFPDPEFDRIAEEIKDELRPRYDWADWRQSGWAQNRGLRILDAWSTNPNVKRVACNNAVLDLLGQLYGRRAWPFQTLNFATGTQQNVHSDSLHFSSLPERFMCGVWVALEDISPEAGPLVYYPGSHRWPVIYNEYLGVSVRGRSRYPGQDVYEPYWQAMIEKHGVAPAYFQAKKGQALIWAANLLHGGSRQVNAEATRWSQVTHYYFDDCMYVTPLACDMPVGNLMLREMVDISTGEVVRNRFLGTPLRELAPDSRFEVARDTRGSLPPVAIDTLPADFDVAAYLTLNKDVAKPGIDPVQHFLAYGFNEGRRYRRSDVPPGTPLHAIVPSTPPPQRAGLVKRLFGQRATP